MYDYLIQNARIVDGSGAPSFFGSVALSGRTIAAVGALDGVEAAHVLDAKGRCLTPGFWDIHRHGDAILFREDYGQTGLAQGLTTVINGNCGLSLAPLCGTHQPEILAYLSPIVGALPAGRTFPQLSDYLRQAESTHPRLNVGMLVGMGTLRACVTGFENRPLSDAEYRELHRLLEQALSDGALGVSLGLGYAPECFYSTEQLIRALEPLRRSGKVITVHMRQEGDGVVDALDEMLTVARALETPVEISHLKAIGTRNWNRAVPTMLERIAHARAAGLDVMCDVYPYPAGSTQLIHVLPTEFQSGGTDALTHALQDPASRSAMKARMETGTDFENITALVGFENVHATALHTDVYRPFEGKSIAEIADALGQDPFTALFDLLAAEHCTPSMIDFIAAESDIEAILQAPFSGVISDSTYPAGLLHPRVYGTYARLLEHYVREKQTLTLEAAVHKITQQPADRFGVQNKGRIAVGADADLCLFDPAQVHECGTWSNPEQRAQGMDWVFVNGQPVIADGQFTDARKGEILR